MEKIVSIKTNYKIMLSMRLLFLFMLSLTHAQSKKIDMKDRFQINKDGSYVTFETSYFGFPIIRGSLKAYQATIFYDPTDIQSTSATIRFGTTGISTAHDKRDVTLTSNSFLDATNFPGMWFQSTKVTPTKDGFNLIGTLNIKNIKKQVTVKVKTPTVMRKAMNLNDLMMMKGSLSINRKEFNLGTSSPHNKMLGDNIDIQFHFLCSNYTIDYLKATFVREVAPGLQHPVGIVYNEVKNKGLKKGKKKLTALTKDSRYAKTNWMSSLANLGWILMVDGKADEGLEFFNMALKRDPKHFLSLIRMGDAYVIGGHYKKALNHYRKERSLPERAKYTHLPHLIKLLNGKFDLTNMK